MNKWVIFHPQCRVTVKGTHIPVTTPVAAPDLSVAERETRHSWHFDILSTLAITASRISTATDHKSSTSMLLSCFLFPQSQQHSWHKTGSRPMQGGRELAKYNILLVLLHNNGKFDRIRSRQTGHRLAVRLGHRFEPGFVLTQCCALSCSLAGKLD